MRVKVGEVDDKTKETRGGTIYRAKCSWDGYKEQWTSLYFQPEPNRDYDGEVVAREWHGKILWTVKKGVLVGAQPATHSESRQAQPQSAPAKENYSPAVPKKAVVLMHNQAWREAQDIVGDTDNEALFQAFTIAAARLTTSIVMGWKMDANLYPLACEAAKQIACKAAKQMLAREEPDPEPEPREPDYDPMDELPPDNDIPF